MQEQAEPSPPTITVNKDAEFFVSVCKEEGHSFLVLGVINGTGEPKRLLSIGQRWSVDPSVQAGNKWHAADRKAIVLTGEGALSAIMEEMHHDEGKENDADWNRDINYKSYAISYHQYKGFLGLVAEIEEKQNKVEEIATGKRTGKFNKIQGYIPTSETEKTVTLTRKGLERTPNMENNAEALALAKKTSHITQTNNCRKSTLAILKAGFGFTPNVSAYFWRAPGYSTTFKGGNPEKDTFYILPPPPTSYPNYNNFSDKKKKIFALVHEQLEKIPNINPENKLTRDKFNALKTLYNDLAGNPLKKADELLIAINAWEEKHRELINKRRDSPWYKTSHRETATQKTLNKIKKTLETTSGQGLRGWVSQWIKNLFSSEADVKQNPMQKIKSPDPQPPANGSPRTKP